MIYLYVVTHFAWWLLYILSDDCSWITMSPPTKNTSWLGIIATFCFVSISSYFASSCLELPFFSIRIAFGNFSDYSPVVLIVLQFLFRVLSFIFASSSILFFSSSLPFSFWSTSVLLLWRMYSWRQRFSFFFSFFVFFLIFNGVQKC